MKNLKFRVWHKEERKMLYEEIIGESFVWLHKEKQPIEIMQSTGLKDKNNVEIFENDILEVDYQGQKFFSNYVGQVEYSKGCFWCIKHNGYGGDRYTLSGLTDDTRTYRSTLKIIGNIYENPELLK